MVQGITQKRMPQRCHVDTDLMGAAGFQAEHYKGCRDPGIGGSGFQDGIYSLCRFAAWKGTVRRDHHFQTVLWIWGKGSCDPMKRSICIFRHGTGNRSQVGFL